MNTNRAKYPRTPHLPWSSGRTKDDIALDSVQHLEQWKDVVVTEKLDGENTTEYHNTPMTICCWGIGAGQISNVMEELINLGSKVFIQIGATGTIQEHIATGDVIIPTGSVGQDCIVSTGIKLFILNFLDMLILLCQLT